jgi:hypothetical protein
MLVVCCVASESSWYLSKRKGEMKRREKRTSLLVFFFFFLEGTVARFARLLFVFGASWRWVPSSQKQSALLSISVACRGADLVGGLAGSGTMDTTPGWGSDHKVRARSLVHLSCKSILPLELTFLRPLFFSTRSVWRTRHHQRTCWLRSCAECARTHGTRRRRTSRRRGGTSPVSVLGAPPLRLSHRMS